MRYLLSQALCGACPLPAPSSEPPIPAGGLALALCTDVNALAIYMYADVAVAGFQFDLICGDTMDAISDLTPGTGGSALEQEYQVSAGVTGTVVGVSLSGAQIPPTADPLLVTFTSAGEIEACSGIGACLISPVFSDPAALAIDVALPPCGAVMEAPAPPPPIVVA